MNLSNKEIVDNNINLIAECVSYQFAKCKDRGTKNLKADFLQDLILIMYEYDNEKLNDAYLNNHLNALITRIILNNIYSKTSPLYTLYKKFDERTDEITPQIEDTYES